MPWADWLLGPCSASCMSVSHTQQAHCVVFFPGSPPKQGAPWTSKSLSSLNPAPLQCLRNRVKSQQAPAIHSFPHGPCTDDENLQLERYSLLPISSLEPPKMIMLLHWEEKDYKVRCQSQWRFLRGKLELDSRAMWARPGQRVMRTTEARTHRPAARVLHSVHPGWFSHPAQSACFNCQQTLPADSYVTLCLQLLNLEP